MQIETVPASQLSRTQMQQIAELLVRVWSDSEKTVAMRKQRLYELGRTYQGPAAQQPCCSFVCEGDRMIAHATFVARTIETLTGPMTIAGLSLVCTDPSQRGRGLGEAVVRPVFDLIDQGAFPFALFQTSNEVMPFYQRLGAVPIDNPIINSQSDHPTISPFYPESVIMRYPDGNGWPEGEIDLRGPGY